MSPATMHAVAQLYAIFEKYPHGAVAGCPCCTSAEAKSRLVSKRLRELTGEDLGGYAQSALYTWGTLRDFKHFLQRILELKADGSLWTDVQIIYNKLTYEGPWLPEELRAIQQFTEARFIEALDHGDACTALAFLEAAGVGGLDVEPLLQQLTAVPGPARASALAQIVFDRAFAWIWWKEGYAVLEARLLDGDSLAFLQRTFEAHIEHPDSSTWAEASDILEALSV